MERIKFYVCLLAMFAVALVFAFTRPASAQENYVFSNLGSWTSITSV
jgi:hypothetical protein